MGPEVLALAPYIAAAGATATAAGTVYGAQSQAASMRAQADADQVRSIEQQQISSAKALEERAAAQRTAGEELRTARLVQSRLGAVAGASGSGTSDPTVMNLWEGIQKEGQKNADYATAAGDQKAQGLTYQAALDRWSTDVNAGIKRRGADATALGGYLTGAGQFASGMSSMALKYNTGRTSTGGSTGYGGR